MFRIDDCGEHQSSAGVSAHFGVSYVECDGPMSWQRLARNRLSFAPISFVRIPCSLQWSGGNLVGRRVPSFVGLRVSFSSC